jgi:RimJ/RimL family protein N-acetyltransferase
MLGHAYGTRVTERAPMNAVELFLKADNSASLRVARKAGFTEEGILRRASLEEDGLQDLTVLSLLDDEI